MIKHVKRVRIDSFLIYGLSISLIVTLSCVEKVVKNLHSTLNINSVIIENKPDIKATLFDSHAFDSVVIEGKAYIVYDLVNRKVIASHNENVVLPLASITKVMMAISSVLHKDKNDKIVISRKNIEGSYDLGLHDKQVWNLSELLKYTLLFSSNDGAEAIADSFGDSSVFLNYMNTDAKNLGLNLVFTDPAGRDVGYQVGGEGTALDVAKLFGIAREKIPDILDSTTKKRETMNSNSGNVIGIPNTNQYIENIPGAEASKTGYTDKAGGNLGIIVDVSVGHPVVLVVLGSTKEGRFTDIQKLYKALIQSLNEPKNINN